MLGVLLKSAGLFLGCRFLGFVMSRICSPARLRLHVVVVFCKNHKP